MRSIDEGCYLFLAVAFPFKTSLATANIIQGIKRHEC